MKHFLFCLLLLHLSIIQGFSQIHSIGHRTVTFNDASRTGGYGSGGGTGRQIQTEIYYPSSALADGDSTPLAIGKYPLLIFGHGFVMTWSSYDNIWKDLVPQGYIVCFPRTEGSTSPSHTDFGKDLALLQSKMQGLSNNPTHFFYNSLTTKVAIMGHSMGGGSAFLACAGNVAPTTMVTFAAANTNPSSINAAKQVTIPTLLIAGGNDCVAPPAKHQDSMYMTCASGCKAEVTIKGASHCEFADQSTTCSFGQGTCSPQPTISGAQERALASGYYSNWLRYWLKGDCPSWTNFLDSVNQATTITKQISCSETCLVSGIENRNWLKQIQLSPNPAQDRIHISYDREEDLFLGVFTSAGQIVRELMLPAGGDYVMDVSGEKSGLYFMVFKNKRAERSVLRFVKVN